VALLGTGAAMSWMIWRAVHGQATLGDLALFYQAFNRGQDLMRSLLGSVGQIYSNSRFLGNLFTFLELQPEVADAAAPVAAPGLLKQGIAFRDVTFRYPGSERPALQHFNLTIPAGKIVAIVGLNGAGKTTLVKLLCRFYDPQDGSVELDGVDIRAIAVEELRRQITVLFQFPMPYQCTASENIALGDVQRAVSAAQIEAAARSAGAHETIARLAHGYETQLGKWFGDGVELSGGEWQRLAMARAYLRQAPILALDEPTSAMDSWAEADWFDRLRTLASGRTGLIITHRFTIAMRADIIHVMDDGRIVESGSHAELLAQGGQYASSWNAQMQAASADHDLVASDAF
jgi:ATP-binding cassette subfamily B protein